MKWSVYNEFMKVIFTYFFTVIKSDSLTRIYIYITQDPATESNSQNAGKKRNLDPRRGMETEIHELPVDSSRSLEYQYEYLSVTYCQHRRYAEASPLPSSALVRSIATPGGGTRSHFVHLSTSAAPLSSRELPFHWQPLLRKSSPFGFKWGLVHTMPRVIYSLGTRGSSTCSDEPGARGRWRSDSSIDTQHFIVIGFFPLLRAWILF